MLLIPGSLGHDMIELRTGWVLALALGPSLLSSEVQGGTGLLANLAGLSGGEPFLFEIDPATAIATEIGGMDGPALSELEYGNGQIYASNTSARNQLICLDPATGQETSIVTLTFPLGGDVLTALEFVGPTLYGGMAEDDEGGLSSLVTIDVATGVVTLIGATGIANPLGGLAMSAQGTMYAVTAGGAPGALYTIDLATGAATLVGPVMVEGVTIGTTALEFGCDGVLYALPNPSELLAGHLLRLDPATGLATNLGDSGLRFNALNLETGTGYHQPPRHHGRLTRSNDWDHGIDLSRRIAGFSRYRVLEDPRGRALGQNHFWRGRRSRVEFRHDSTRGTRRGGRKGLLSHCPTQSTPITNIR